MYFRTHFDEIDRTTIRCGELIKGQEEMKVALAASTTIHVDTDIKMIQEKLPCSSNMALIALNDLGEEERLSLVSKIK